MNIICFNMSPEQHFGVLDLKVKKENAGRRKREGRVKSSKVLKIVGCQMAVMPVIRPGRKSAAKFKLSVSTGSEQKRNENLKQKRSC